MDTRLAAIFSVVLTMGYIGLALISRDIATTVALLYIIPLLTFMALGRNSAMKP